MTNETGAVHQSTWEKKPSGLEKLGPSLLITSIKENWAVTWYTLCKPVSTIRVTAGQKKSL